MENCFGEKKVEQRIVDRVFLRCLRDYVINLEEPLNLLPYKALAQKYGGKNNYFGNQRHKRNGT
ncbi:predicted protein [Sclerotinia sclerotiorum 1980 UF-70]|uniref:Uncharacterized protein n=1 Tax=Sclerotinia sclerotiorum (strain ATCC 18683 / 1980 / Ss-1) TaxID=665079 RepID=A7F1Q9_SCLS1|nr:predicted protein [Sclerotinia sclerotiorum 1980 UF-70]EDN95651.1 predicted protein [Sclerotinia sclerotiorum 1980 UF-70]